MLSGTMLFTSNGCKKDKPTPAPITVTDVDGNTYKTITIGTQVWMAENLKTTQYADKTPIPEITDLASWTIDTKGAMCWYQNDASNKAKYGALYNWFAVTNPAGLAPQGWHVASDADWQTLEDYLIANGYNYDGSKTGNKIGKAVAATVGWTVDQTLGHVGNSSETNNKTGFNLPPAGFRYSNDFGFSGEGAYLWTTTSASNKNAIYRGLNSYGYDLTSDGQALKNSGMSIRCVKD